MLADIDTYLVNANEEYPPKYTGILKAPTKATIAKWQSQIDVLLKQFKDDSELGFVGYKLLLCQALVYYLSDNPDAARNFFNGAMDFERFDIVLYYVQIVKSVGANAPANKRGYDKRPHSSFAFELAMKNSKGKIPLHKHLTVGIPYMVGNHFSDWSEDEVNRYVLLRSIEWLALPAFVAIGIGAPLILVVPAVWLIVIIALLNFLWSLVATKYVSLRLAILAFYLNKLKFLTVPLIALVLFLNRNYGLMIVAIIWPLIGILLSLVRVSDKGGVIAHKMKQGIFLLIHSSDY